MANEKAAEIAASYTLKKPIDFGSRHIEVLNFREPTAKDFRRFPLTNQTAGDVLDVVAMLSGEPAAVIDEIKGADLIGLMELAIGFLPADLATGLKL